MAEDEELKQINDMVEKIKELQGGNFATEAAERSKKHVELLTDIKELLKDIKETTGYILKNQTSKE